ncbi:DUF1295 domain-containing protein [soil metagenome]
MNAVLLASAVTLVIVMLVTWSASLAAKDASIVDIVWGLAFVAVAVVAAVIVGEGSDDRRLLLTVLVTVWGVRLAGYLAWRNRGREEDYRYRAMRKKYGDRFPVMSLVTVFGTQGLLAWIVSLPVQLAATAARPPGLGPLALIGVVVWAVGLFFEAVGDVQLARFKDDPANEGQVMDHGLWRYTRHPNYFGDFCVWWGIFLIAAETGPGRWGIVGPIVMSVLLLKVSGVAMLERTITERRPAYADYARRTSAFFPRPPH